MKRMAGLFVAVLLLACSAPAQSKAERDQAVKYLKDTQAAVRAATKGLTPAQWNFKPAPDRWSVAEVVEHIAAAEDYLDGLVTDKVMTAPARTETEDVQALDAMVKSKIPDRTNKVQAPEPLKPTNRYGSPEGSLKHFAESRAKTIEMAKKTPGLRDHAVDSPLGKKLDGYEWLLFVAGHSERHTKQILEVKADPNFPKA
jgi:hypothetical protein